MVDNKNNVKAWPSALTQDGSSFQVTWEHQLVGRTEAWTESLPCSFCANKHTKEQP
jgi:hypothetical protein